jgi:membrane associated rhomboid family serine protease
MWREKVKPFSGLFKPYAVTAAIRSTLAPAPDEGHVMRNLPYRAVNAWAYAALIAIAALNAALFAVAKSPEAYPWLVTPETAFALKMLLHPSPWINWMRGSDVPWQDVPRLLKHGYLHGNWGHWTFNMLPFFLLGWLTVRRVGVLTMLLLYHLLMLLAGFGYLWAMYLTANGTIYAGDYFVPVAGASGAVHGLGGLWVVWAVQDRAGRWTEYSTILRRIWPAALWLGFVIAANTWVYVAMQGQFAWALHIVGVACGMALAPFIPNLRPRRGPL